MTMPTVHQNGSYPLALPLSLILLLFVSGYLGLNALMQLTPLLYGHSNAALIWSTAPVVLAMGLGMYGGSRYAFRPLKVFLFIPLICLLAAVLHIAMGEVLVRLIENRFITKQLNALGAGISGFSIAFLSSLCWGLTLGAALSLVHFGRSSRAKKLTVLLATLMLLVGLLSLVFYHYLLYQFSLSAIWKTSSILYLVCGLYTVALPKDIKERFYRPHGQKKTISARQKWITLLHWAYWFGSGLLFIAYLQLVRIYTENHPFTWPLMLLSYLGIMALGMLGFAWLGLKLRRRYYKAAWLMLLSALSSLALYASSGNWLNESQKVASSWSFKLFPGFGDVQSMVYVLLPIISLMGLHAFFSGMLLSSQAKLGTQPGRCFTDLARFILIAAFLTTTGIASGYILVLPSFGSDISIKLILTLGIVLSSVSVLRFSQNITINSLSSLLALAMAAYFVFSTDVQHSEKLLAQRHGTSTLHYRESPEGNTAIFDSHGIRELNFRGQRVSMDLLPERRRHELSYLLPYSLHPLEVRKIFVLGGDLQVGAQGPPFADSLEIKHLYDPLDLPYFPELYPESIIGRWPQRSLLSKRMRLYQEKNKYDLIVDASPELHRFGAMEEHSSAYYSHLKNLLGKGGLYCQSLSLSQVRSAQLKHCLATLLNTFDYISLWSVEKDMVLLIGSNHPQPLDFEKIEQRVESSFIKKRLNTVGVKNRFELLSTYICGPQALENYCEGKSEIHDPEAMMYWRATTKQPIPPVLHELMALSQPPPIMANEEDKNAIRYAHERMLRFYKITSMAQEGLSGSKEAYLEEFALQLPSNTYYDWYYDKYFKNIAGDMLKTHQQ